MEKERLYTAEEVRQMLNLKSVQTVYRWGWQGKIPRIKVGTLVRFQVPEEWIAKGK